MWSEEQHQEKSEEESKEVVHQDNKIKKEWEQRHAWQVRIKWYWRIKRMLLVWYSCLDWYWQNGGLGNRRELWVYSLDIQLEAGFKILGPVLV